jgi:tripartite-type tricarboxylate transporter receptor subunit TctC
MLKYPNSKKLQETSMRLLCLIIAALPLLFAGAAPAQDYPVKPVRIIVPFPPGQATDILARLLGDQLGRVLGQSVVVDNRPGAGGSLGTEAAARSAPDGYTLVMASIASFSISPALYAKLPYDPVKDFAPITNVGLTPQTLVTGANSEFHTLKDFIAAARAGEVSYASSGNGSASHLSMEMLRNAAGLKLLHAAFKGNAEAATQVMGGQIPVMFDAIPGIITQVRGGKLRALAIASARRSPYLPEVPTVAEQGFPGFEAVGWIGLAAPAGTPPAVLDTLSTACRGILAQPEIKGRLAALAFTPAADTREEFGAFLKDQLARWKKAVQDSGTRID